MTINCTVQFINLHWILDLKKKKGVLSEIGYMCFSFSVWSGDQWCQTALNSSDVAQSLLEVTVMEVEEILKSLQPFAVQANYLCSSEGRHIQMQIRREG